MAMDLTGNLIMTGSFLSFSFVAAAVLLKFEKLFRTLYNLDDLCQKFELLWKKPGKFAESHPLLNLSYTYSALKKQLKRQGKADKYTLGKALKNAEERASIFPSDEEERLHFAALRKFKELQSKSE